ncbi:hypothetical protein [Oceaniradius stylonematis]|uniref:hypothetical protein n=1 Tax=Oceaniradius stylonematis TaxID=2184161 RepID=UPI00273EF3A2|nr:hypothetical protein [Oceaniradius stylonematis]
MSAIGTIIGGIAAEIGATTVKRLIEQRAGKGAAEIAGTVIDVVATKAGVPARELPELVSTDRKRVEEAVMAAEADGPELLELWSRGLEGQFALMQAETREGFWRSFWRWGWMYLLAIFWIWRIVVLPIANAYAVVPIETIDVAVLLTLTSWFMGLYMGGHTLKELGKNVAALAKERMHR